MATYASTFYYPDGTLCGPKEYATAVEPVEYNGFLLYQRERLCIDIVKDGMVVGMRGSMDAAKESVHNFVHGRYDDEYHMHEVLILKKKRAA